MKITKRQLRRIIKEEKLRMISEVEYYGTSLDTIKKDLMSELYTMDPNEMRAEIYLLIDELENMANRG